MARRSKWWFLLALVCVAAFAWAGEAVAGERGPWSVEVASGVEEVGSRDDVGSPLSYRGRGAPLVLRGERVGEVWTFKAEAGGFGTGLNGGWLRARQAEVDRRIAEGIFIDATLGLRRVLWRRGALEASAGGQVGHWTFFRSYRYGPNQIGAVETWEVPLTLDATGSLRMELRPGLSAEAGVALPLVGRMLRPHYAVRGDERMELLDNRHRVFEAGRWTSWHNLQMTRLTLGAELGLVGPLALTLQTRLGALRYRDTTEIRTYTGRLTLGLRLAI